MKPSDVPRQLLLVEDNPGDALLIRELLEEPTGSVDHVVHVETLSEATSRLPSLDIDAVLLDLHLPDGRGVECVRAVRARGEDMPIVVLTGLEDDDLALNCIRAGAQDYLPKGEVRGPNLKRAIGYAIARVREHSERRRADALQQRLAAIVETSPDAIVSTTVDGLVTTWNRGAERLFGHRRIDAVGRPVDEVICIESDDAASIRDPATTARDDASTSAQKLVCVRPDGSRADLSATRCLLRDSRGVVVAHAAIYRDVTETKRMETQLALSDRMVTLGTLAAGVAHEVNNPLASVIANVELALAGLRRVADSRQAVEPAIEALDDAQEAAHRVRRIVRDLRVFSRPDDEPRGPVDVHPVVESSLRMARNLLRHRARVERDYGSVTRALANESRLGQVVLNLLVNAAQAIEPGNRDGNTVCVQTRMTDSGMIRIAVSDTGAGMAPETRKQLFTPFFTTKPIGTGTGLGLAICHRIVTSFGGTIEVDSAQGEGTTVAVILPATEADTIEPGGSGNDIAHASDLEIGGRRGRILVVDDDAMILATIRRTLSDDHDVEVTSDPARAVDRLRSGEEFDLIVCDVMMPQLTGMDFYHCVAELRQGIERRIVFLTGGAFTPATRAFLDSVANRRLDKPFDPAKLRAVVTELVANQES